MNNGESLPKWLVFICGVCTVLATSISIYSQCRQLWNYRIPSQQRLILRIQMMVPIFSISCFVSILRPEFGERYVEPIREIYEALVIYQFFSYLTLVLGGERNIIINIAPKYPPSKHAMPLLGYFLREIDLSDPYDFGMLKRGVLQYVWFKPFYCIGMALLQTLHWDTLWLVVLYNLSVTWSLYCLAMFWKCLYQELSVFKPWPKFMCVKLIIFASYWQSLIIDVLTHFDIIDVNGADKYIASELGNSVLCVEMIGFAIAHLYAFSADEYGAEKYPNSGRLKVYYALRDWLGFKDLCWDFKSVINGDYSNYRGFDSVESMLADRGTHSRTNRLARGLRYTNRGMSSYWVGSSSSSNSYGTIQRDMSNDDLSTPWTDITEGLGLPRYIPEDSNYPVVWDAESHRYEERINALRQQLRSKA
ncbi:transmembrane protein 184 homolog YKR051W [Kluyveromyces marxianus]|uniref:Transmembrane protein 184 homolog YKR051W n=1 Tax=Kluyveromyces marxianus (strain DMKU3-1042 / BCC 29191 / NBRC 104275) TaxID=1003335 RepID=W0TEW4_KLUMD|nr:uncharacterized protein KLMA_60040 [Kluyveromyces marxianus DMKU3-1042]BAO41331.1 transmembrane protein 184 homolog YKR051W [Kluyveromyces marxianus DMKU3-1042]BAP72783.1 transmembrane protein 184 homolog YKR051W [Kluyveromyces marxianus]